MTQLRTVHVIRYLTPLREGGSLPAIVEADDGFLYVIKFRGAGQGKKALIAELIGGELARALGLRVPELVFMELDDRFGRTEPDEEIQDLLKFSIGLNLGLHYLSGAVTYDPAVSLAEPLEASLVALLDSLILNIDRTHRNPNLLNWRKELWLIDHGASLYFHHAWANWQNYVSKPFPRVSDHVLLARASQLAEAGEQMQATLTEEVINGILAMIPEDWLQADGWEGSHEEKRSVYRSFLLQRLELMPDLIQEAEHARKKGI